MSCYSEVRITKKLAQLRESEIWLKKAKELEQSAQQITKLKNDVNKDFNNNNNNKSDNKIKELLENNKKWSADKNKNDKGLFDKLKEQDPKILWIGCADSRVSPELITQSGFGKLFVHRNIANQFKSDDTNCMSVLEYSVKVLEVCHIVVCGHRGCAGVRNCYNKDLEPNLIKWLKGIHELGSVNPEFSQSNPHFGTDEVQYKLVKANVVRQVEKINENHLVKFAKHKIQVHGLVFDIKNGLLEDLTKYENKQE
ncbi:15013_t:CDS:2 [Entrophospora sp. SA101]|nr:15013_t:CDS:2 [Entrophospora sp. SA101]